jgi:hypothetical protein
MGPAKVAAPLAPPWRPWPMRSRANVIFLPGERRAAERISRRWFQRTLQPCEYAGLAGAPDDAAVEVGVLNDRLYIELGGPRAAYRAHSYLFRKRRILVLLNDGFHIHARPMQNQGLGLQIFHRQVHNAAALGVGRIETVAGRRARENGYYTWPRFGFDGVLPASVRRILPPGLEGSRSVLDLMRCEKGRAWWREHGATIRVAFDLARGSRSRRALAQYVRKRTAADKIASGPKRNLEIRRATCYSIAR